MTFFYSRDGIVKMRSEEPLDAPSFDCVEIKTTQEEEDNLSQNIPHKIENEKLVFDKKPDAIDVKALIEKATTIDELKTIILDNLV